MTENTLKELYLDELRDLYDNENQLIKALPKMAKEAKSDELRSGIERHLEETKNHAKRIEQIFDAMGESAKGKKCRGMQGIIAEGSAALKEDWEGPLRDSAIIASAQRAEHYEIAAYGTVHEFAGLLGESNAASLIAQTLDEEKQTDRKLTELAHGINQAALAGVTEGATKHHAKSAGR
jgi:ferritin-like metal-binding protein YciE